MIKKYALEDKIAWVMKNAGRLFTNAPDYTGIGKGSEVKLVGYPIKRKMFDDDLITGVMVLYGEGSMKGWNIDKFGRENHVLVGSVGTDDTCWNFHIPNLIPLSDASRVIKSSSDFPISCRKCSSPAYMGFSSLVCSAGCNPTLKGT